jgi:hypothetical protein
MYQAMACLNRPAWKCTYLFPALLFVVIGSLQTIYAPAISPDQQ